MIVPMRDVCSRRSAQHFYNCRVRHQKRRSSPPQSRVFSRPCHWIHQFQQRPLRRVTDLERLGWSLLLTDDVTLCVACCPGQPQPARLFTSHVNIGLVVRQRPSRGGTTQRERSSPIRTRRRVTVTIRTSTVRGLQAAGSCTVALPRLARLFGVFMVARGVQAVCHRGLPLPPTSLYDTRRTVARASTCLCTHDMSS